MTKKERVKILSNHLQFLSGIGLSSGEAVVYEILVKNGPMIAHKLSLESQLSRPLTYKILDQLEVHGLVSKKSNGTSKVNLFEALPPTNLEKFVKRKNFEFIESKASYEEVLPELNFLFTKRHHQASIQYFEGIKGLGYLHADILKEKKDILLFRSFLDQSQSETHELIQKQRKLQALCGIKVRLISPRKVDKILLERDKEYFIERKYIDPGTFSLPSQIVVYGNKVGIVSYVDGVHTSIIYNEAVNASVKSIFELLWTIARDPQTIMSSE